MNTIIVTSSNLGCYGWLFQQHLMQRKKRFVEEMAWDIPHDEHVERDQYDRHDTTYVLLEEHGALVGYARLLPTTSHAQYGQARFTYMVKDACEGLLLPGIPQDIYEGGQPPVDDRIWEMTRFQTRDRRAMSTLFRVAADYLRSIGAKGTISFTRTAYSAILSASGLPTTKMGPEVRYPDGKTYCVLETDLCAGKPVASSLGQHSQEAATPALQP